MLGLKVTINDGEPVVAGARDLAVLAARVTLAGQLGDLAKHPRPGEPPDLMVHLGGLTSRSKAVDDEHMEWLSRSDLEVGDKITIEIVETDRASDPVWLEPAKRKG